MAETNEWYRESWSEVLKQLDATTAGLDEAEVRERLGRYGLNRLERERRKSPWLLLLEQFRNVLVLTLLVATVLSAFLGHAVEAVTIAVIVLFAILLGFVQEFRAERSIEALRAMAAPQARVRRRGRELLIPSEEVVPGDVLLLSAGDRVAADARLFVAVNLRVDESALTGESVPVDKDAESVIADPVVVADRLTMVFAGTTVSYGRAEAVVTTTGMATEFGRIASILKEVQSEQTPLQKNLDRVGTSLARVALVIVAVIVVLGLVRGESFVDILVFGIALAVAVVPEALPAVVTISLALGVQRMVKRNALMRRLPVVETLGSTTVICSDKTGTLTKNEMTVRLLYPGDRVVRVSGSGYDAAGSLSLEDGEPMPEGMLNELLRAGVLCNDAVLESGSDGSVTVSGDPTEAALLVVARKGGLDEVEQRRLFRRIAELPFSSETKYMATLHQSTLHESGSDRLLLVKGAVEVVLAGCTSVSGVHGPVDLDDAMRRSLLAKADEFAGEALRVLAFASKAEGSIDQPLDGMRFLGFVGMIDPPRREARDAVARCRAAGIRPVMITGDHPVTAEAIARELGILGEGRVVSGLQLARMNGEELSAAVGNISVFARVAPEHKLQIVDALQRKGEIVAMTGDGVNDAPALKKADIGIAMGQSGTDVAREASAMMLTDDNFASIVAAIEEGRVIFDNIRKYLTYLLSSNAGELGLMAFATVMGVPLPLSAVQLLYVNLATDGLPALALAVDPADDGVMDRQPLPASDGIFTHRLLSLILVGGFWSTLVNLVLFFWALGSGRLLAEAMSMTFLSLVLIQFFKAYNFRSDTRSVLHRPFANRWLNLAVGWELLMLLALIEVPFLRQAFGLFPLTLTDFIIVIGGASTIVPVLELLKWGIRRGMRRVG